MVRLGLLFMAILFMPFNCSQDVGGIYESVRKVNTIQAYEKFIADHHDSQFVDSAKLSLAKLEFERCVTSIDFQKFVKKHSNNIYADSAKFLLMVEEFNAVKEKNTIEGFKSFLKKYSGKKFTDEIEESIKNLEEKAEAKKYETSDKGIKKKVKRYLSKLDGRYGVKRGVYQTKRAYISLIVKDGNVRITVNCVVYGRNKGLIGATVNTRMLLQGRDYCKEWSNAAKKDIKTFSGVKSVVVIDKGG